MLGAARQDRDFEGPVGGSLSLENGPRGRTLGVGEERAGLAYRWPPVSRFGERELSGAYTALTGRKVWRSVLKPLILAARLHGPDTIPLLRELYGEGGVQDLLARLLACPPRLAPHPDYNISALSSIEAEPHGPVGPRSSEQGATDGATAISSIPVSPGTREEFIPQLPERSRPPDCPYPRHEPTWAQRPDGTMRCMTCHP
jgi:hypothetical protein